MAHQIDESKPKYLSQTRFMSGRRIIKTSVTEITDENVVDVLRKALATHDLNRSEIDYLWKYYLAALTDATKAVKILKGTATATADTTVSEGKVYYAKTDNGYIVGKPKTNPKTEGFYEIA